MNKPRTARPLHELVRPVMAEALKAQGFATADIFALWPDIVGGRLASRSMPIRLLWPPRPKTATASQTPEPATLILKVESAFAWEIEMAAAQILERINGVFGWRCVGKLRLRQGPVETHGQKAVSKPPFLDADRDQILSQDLASIQNAELRDSLHRLGRGVMTRKAGD